MQMEEPIRGFLSLGCGKFLNLEWQSYVVNHQFLRNESRWREEMVTNQTWTEWSMTCNTEANYTCQKLKLLHWWSFGAAGGATSELPLGCNEKVPQPRSNAGTWSLANERLLQTRLLVNRLVELCSWLHFQQIRDRPCLNLAMGVEWSHTFAHAWSCSKDMTFLLLRFYETNFILPVCMYAVNW